MCEDIILISSYCYLGYIGLFTQRYAILSLVIFFMVCNIYLVCDNSWFFLYLWSIFLIQHDTSIYFWNTILSKHISTAIIYIASLCFSSNCPSLKATHLNTLVYLKKMKLFKKNTLVSIRTTFLHRLEVKEKYDCFREVRRSINLPNEYIWFQNGCRCSLPFLLIQAKCTIMEL